MKFHIFHQKEFSTKYLSRVESGPVEVNASILETFRREKEAVDAEQRLNEAQRVALNAMPEFAREVLAEVESKTKVEKLEKNTRKRVFGVLEGATTTYSHWGSEYQETVQAIKEEKTNAVLSVDNVERASKTLEHLKQLYETQVELRRRNLSDTEEFRRKFFRSRWYTLGLPIGYKGDPESKGSERGRFDQREKSARNVLESIQKQIAERMQEAEIYNERTQELLKTGFSSLTPAEKTTFLDQVQTEITGGRPSGHPFSTITSGTDKHQRLEAYRKLGWDKDYYNQEIQTLAKDQESLRTKNKDYRSAIDALNPNFDKIREWTRDTDPDTSIPSLSTLVQELEAYITSHGSTNRETLYAGIPDTENLDDHARFLVISDFLGKEEDITKNITPKKLKAQLLGYLNMLHDTERPDNIENYSAVFETQHGEVKTLYTDAIRKVGLLEKVVAPPVTPAHYRHIKDISKDVATKKQAYDQVRSQLDPNEQTMLDGYYKDLEELVVKLADLENTWREKTQEFAKYNSDITDWTTRKSALEVRVSTAEGLLNGTPQEQRARIQAIQAAEELLQRHLEKKPSQPEFPILSTVIGQLKFKITQEEARMDNRTINTTNTWKDRIKSNLKQASQKEKNEQYRKRLAEYQSRAFDILLGMPEGRKVGIDFEAYVHGKDFASDDVLTRGSNLQNNLRVMTKTSDGVVLRRDGSTQIFVVQRTAKDQSINVLIFDNPEGYTAGTEINPNFRLSDHPDKIGEPMALTFN